MWKIFVFLIIFIPEIGFAQNTDGANAQRIYFVNSYVAAKNSAIGKEIEARLFARSAELKVLDAQTTEELNAEEDALTAKRETMTMEEFTPLAEEFDNKTIAARQNMDKLSSDMVAARDVQLSRLSSMMEAEVQNLAMERDNVTILNASVAFYLSPDDDLTDLLVARLDALYAKDTEGVENFIFAPVSEASHLTPDTELDNNTTTSN